MGTYRAEPNAELLFDFPDEVRWKELDKQGIKLPEGMKLVDLVIERDDDVLLVEIKDPSHSQNSNAGRQIYFDRLRDNTVLSQDLTPKARDSYCFLHLMKEDKKPFNYIVLIGLDAFAPDLVKPLLLNFKTRLMADLKCEAYKPWERNHIVDCSVLSVEKWNEQFPKWQVTRSPIAHGVRGT